MESDEEILIDPLQMNSTKNWLKHHKMVQDQTGITIQLPPISLIQPISSNKNETEISKKTAQVFETDDTPPRFDFSVYRKSILLNHATLNANDGNH